MFNANPEEMCLSVPGVMRGIEIYISAGILGEHQLGEGGGQKRNKSVCWRKLKK